MKWQVSNSPSSLEAITAPPDETERFHPHSVLSLERHISTLTYSSAQPAWLRGDGKWELVLVFLHLNLLIKSLV